MGFTLRFIKERDKDGVDVVRMNYGKHWTDRIAIELKKQFTENQTKRIDDDYIEKYYWMHRNQQWPVTWIKLLRKTKKSEQANIHTRSI